MADDRRVIIEGLGGSITLETLVLYCESPQCPGGGEVDEDDRETKLGPGGVKACIVFVSKGVVDQVVENHHSLSGKRLKIRRWYAKWDKVPTSPAAVPEIRRSYARPDFRTKATSSVEHAPAVPSFPRSLITENIYESIDHPEEESDYLLPSAVHDLMGSNKPKEESVYESVKSGDLDPSIRHGVYKDMGGPTTRAPTKEPPIGHEVYMDMSGSTTRAFTKEPPISHGVYMDMSRSTTSAPTKEEGDSTYVHYPPRPERTELDLVSDIYLTTTEYLPPEVSESEVTDTVKISRENTDVLGKFYRDMNLKASVEKLADGFKLFGRKVDVDNAKLKLLEASASVEKIPLACLSAQVVSMITEPPCFDEIMASFTNRNLDAIIYKAGSNAFIVAKDAEMAKTCLDLFNMLVSKREFSLDSKTADITGQKAWKDAVKSLSTPPKVHIYVTTNDNTTVVHAEGMKDVVDTACVSLQGLLEEQSLNAKVTEKMEMSPPIWRLLKEIAKLDELLQVNYGMQYGTVVWKFKREGANLFMQVTGPTSEVQIFCKGVKEILSNIQREKLIINKPGLSMKLLTADQGGRQLHTIEVYQQCCIEVTGGRRHDPIGAHAVDISTTDLYRQASSGTLPSTSKVDACPVNLQKGDLSMYQSDVLVCTVVHRAGELTKSGAVGKGFAKAGGSKVEEGYAALCAKNNKVLPLGDVYMTSASGTLRCKHVIYAPLREWNRKNLHLLKDAIKKIIVKCLTKASELKQKSIAFPTTGCGGFRFPSNEVARCFAEVVPEWLKLNSSKLKVTVVCFEDKIQREFEAAFEPQPSQLRPSSPVAHTNVIPHHAHDSNDGVSLGQHEIIFHIHAVDKIKLKQAVGEVHKLITELVVSEEFANECLKNLSKDEETKLLSFGTSDVEVIYEKGLSKVVLSGERTAVIKTMRKVKQFLVEVESRLRDPLEILRAEGVLPYLTALGHEEVKIPRHWTQNAGSSLRECLASEPILTKVDTHMTQAIEGWLKATWDQGHVGHGADATGLSHTSIKVKQVFLNENPRVYQSYAHRLKQACFHAGRGFSKVQTISGLHGEADVLTAVHGVPEIDALRVKDVNEYFLFHGAPLDAKDGIARQGLDSRLGNKGLFGKGGYFAESATKADQYTDRKSRHDGSHYMYICRVLLTDPFICKGSKHFNRPPCNTSGCNGETCTTHEYHDSVIGVEKDGGTRLLFREFVVYDKDRCYPEFLVEYERV